MLVLLRQAETILFLVLSVCLHLSLLAFTLLWPAAGTSQGTVKFGLRLREKYLFVAAFMCLAHVAKELSV